MSIPDSELRVHIRQVLAQSPYRMLLAEEKETSNPIRFFRGTAASMADLRAGWGVFRPVSSDSRILTFSEFAQEFSRGAQGEVLILSAQAGEGKTTFLRQL